MQTTNAQRQKYYRQRLKAKQLEESTQKLLKDLKNYLKLLKKTPTLD
nr:MAG: hypothetical protein [Microvirus sp.]QJB19655.1 MAG: hypothetical protein [Microvirus sp.]